MRNDDIQDLIAQIERLQRYSKRNCSYASGVQRITKTPDTHLSKTTHNKTREQHSILEIK
jgi:hypothetical protein